MKRAIFVAASAVVVLVVTIGAVYGEEPTWATWEIDDGGNGHEYAILMGEATWLDQADAAAAFGGYLATLQSLPEHDFVWALIRDAEAIAPSSSDYYAFGLIQTLEEETWADRAKGWGWITGEEYDEAGALWGYNEPSNSGGNEDYGFIHKTRKNYYGYPYWWNDGKNAGAYRAIVEREGPPPPPQDETPPDICLNDPDPAVLAWSDAPTVVAISGSVTDAESGVASATLTVTSDYSDETIEQPLDLEEDGTFATGVELASNVPSGDPDGWLYTITLSAADNAGNEAAPISVTVLAPPDTSAPSTALNDPEPAVLPWSNALTAVAISGSVVDANSGVASATLTVTSDYSDETIEQSLDLEEDGSFAAGVELASNVPAGDPDGWMYTITLNAADNAGNEAAPISVTVHAEPDTTPPTVTLNSPDPANLPWERPNELKSATISGTAADGETGVAFVRLTVIDEYGEFDEPEPGILLEVGDDGSFQATLQLSSEIEGGDADGRSYEITAVAIDRAGNVSAPDTVFVFARRPSSGNPGNGNPPETPPGHDRRPPVPPGRNR